MLILLAAALVLVAAPALAAAEKPKLKIEIYMAKEVKTVKDGKEAVEAVATDKAASGDTIVYTIKYTNIGKSVAKAVKVMDPIPGHTVYVPDSAAGDDTEITFSTDGGKTFKKPPVMVKAKDNSGKIVEKPAPAEAYTHVRWLVNKDIQPGGSGHTSFKVKVK